MSAERIFDLKMTKICSNLYKMANFIAFAQDIVSKRIFCTYFIPFSCDFCADNTRGRYGK